MNSRVALLALSQEIWYDIYAFLEPADWCHLEATSRHQHQRLDSWFCWMDRARIPLNQKSRAWTPKHRVCRYVLAKRYCQRLIHLPVHQKHHHHHHTASSPSTNLDPYHKIRRHQKVNFLEREYFIQIARHSQDDDYCCPESNDDTSNSSSTTTILWSGFLAGGYESLQLDPIQHEITIASVETNGLDQLSSPWKEWESLLDLAATKGLLAASDNDHEWNSNWDSCVQIIRQHYSIVIVSLEYWLPTSMVDHHSASPSAQQCPQLVLAVIPTYLQEELTPKLLIHRGEEDATRETITEYEAMLNNLDVMRRARMMCPETACVHLWLMPHEKWFSPTKKQRNYHFAELRLDL